MARLTCFVLVLCLIFLSFHRRNSTQERVPIVQIVSPRPTTEAVTEPTNGNEAETPIVVPIASRTRPPPAKSALRKNTSRKRPVIDVDVDDEAADRQAKKQKPNTREEEVDAVTPMVTDTTEMADEESYDPQMPGAFEVATPKPKPAPQPAQVQAGRKRPASDDLEQDQTGQRKRTKHGKVDLATPAAHEEVTAVESRVTPTGSKAPTRPRGTKRARSDVGSEFGDKLRVKKKGKKMEEIVDVEMDDQDKPQLQQQRLVVSNGARKSKRASMPNGKKKPVREDDDEEVMVSTDPLCQGRKIGSEWEIGNRRFKVGPDGRRLRLVPLRTTRKKYEMVRSPFSRLSDVYWVFTLSMSSLLTLCILTRPPRLTSWSTHGSQRKNTNSRANRASWDGKFSLRLPLNVNPAVEDQVCPTLCVKTSSYREKRTSYRSLRALQTNPGRGATHRASN